MPKNLEHLSVVYLQEYYLNDILTVLKSETPKANFLCIKVNEFLNDQKYLELYNYARTEPLKCRQAFENGSLIVQNDLIADRSDTKEDVFTKKRTKIYFSLSSPCSELILGRCEGENCQKSFVNQLIYVRGRVVKVSTPKMVQVKKRYRCRECGHTFENKADFDQFYVITEPIMCPASDACGSTRFEEISTDNKSVLPLCSLYQEITVTETDEGVNFLLPKRTTVVLEDDLVDKCQMSDVVAITFSGILRQRWQPLVKGTSPKIELALHATWISKLNDVKYSGASTLLEMKQKFEKFWRKYEENPLVGRNLILSSVCPDIYEMYLIKLSLMLVLIGGVSGVTSSGTTIRGDPHFLLIGDPGTGKSKFLKHAASLAKRSTYSTGVGITSAGLTCAAVKVDGDWQLEPGALPLSHGGVCCIDEFHTLSESDRASVREAMETQGVSVAKAGVKTVIPSRCAVFAAMNQDNRFRCIDAPLLSRFDLILTLNAETSDENFEHDLKIANFLTENNNESVSKNERDEPFWNQEMIKTYIACAKDLSPTMSEGAEKILSQYFEFQRQQSFLRDDGKTTNRLRDGLIRVAQAHARLMYRPVVTVQDAIIAIFMMDCSMQGTELLGPVDVLHTYFPNDPSAEYETKGKRLLEILGLNRYISELTSNEYISDFDSEFNRVIGRVRSASSLDKRKSPPPLKMDSIYEAPENSYAQFEAVMTQIRCKEPKTNGTDTTKSIWSDRLKQFEFNETKAEKRILEDDDDLEIGIFNETKVEKRILEDDDDLEIDINDLVWCSSKRKKVTL